MPSFFRNFSVLFLAMLAGGLTFAQEGGVPAEHHPWGRFPKGSWKRTRATTELLDQLGNVTATTSTETTTTLIAADASTYTLRIEVITESAGKRFVNKSQTKIIGYSGNAPGEPVTTKKLGSADVEVNGHKIPCELRQIHIEGMGAKYEGTIYVNSAIPPYVLRQEGTATAATDGPKTTTQVEVVAFGPFKVLVDRRNAAFVRTIERRGDQTITTMEITCDDIPGGEVAHSSQEQNAENKPLRRTTLELLDYHIGNERNDEAWGGRRRVLHRSRPRRGE